MQYSHKAYACADTFGIIVKFHQCLGDRTEEEIIHDFLIAENKGIEFCGDGEDDMKVLYRKEVFSSGLNPFLFP
jgi:hypothetical protein